jgi:hypothetical protein
MIVAIVLIVFVFIVVGVMLSRQSTKTKKVAIADLEDEKETVGTFDIFELVESEVNALGLLDIEGSKDIPHGVLLKIWSDQVKVVSSCADRSHLQFVVSNGIDPSDATNEDVTLECTKAMPKDDELHTADDS